MGNRIEMERILGKEKYKKFMQNARKQFQKHGRHGGTGFPPMPGRRPGGKAPPMPDPNAPPPVP